ncbi:ABC transporter permease [Rugosimonospora africana]|uniref:ABC transporter substrate-binding protein n=1 Tax=Rugosimonospora africana TaxID=556532 RepID=A0A8J3QVV6_9ACTN|nr:FtsX-like permease family protein [Rugosimonospora africana]GIH16775.1 ABC transporter substrate-binding protein [Rugosimonospora africana]
MSAPVVRVTLRGLWFRRRRLVGLFVAVFLGVAFLAGILGLSATMTDAIDTSYQTANRGVDAIVRSGTEVASGADEIRGPIPVSVLDAVRSAPGVADAQAEAKGAATITGADGKLVTGLGPRDAGTWIADAALNPWRIVAGSAPRGPADIVIDRASATAGHLTPGSTTTVYAPDPVRVTVTGIATYGGQDANGGSSYVAFTLAGAQRYLLGDSGAVSDIVVRADTGVAEDSLVAAIGAALPDGVEAVGGRQATRDQIATVDDGFLKFFKAFLDIFAGIALLVAALSIHNTFSVVAAGRARELALLRVLGARRSQALRGLVLEAAVLGLVGSVAGVAAGYGMAAGLKGAFAGLGLPLPLHGVVFTVADALIAVGVGVVVTVVATLSTAVRASRTPPLAALTAVAVDTSAASRARPVAGLAVTAAGAAGTAFGAAGSSDVVTGVAAVATLVGLIILGPATCAWAARAAGRFLGGANRVNARIAQRNVLRSPARVASAGAALMVGVALVAMFAVIGASISASTTGTLGAMFTGDLVVSGGGSAYGNSGFSPQVATRVAAVPGVGTAAGVGTGQARIAGTAQTVTVADPVALARAFTIAAGAGRLAVSRTVAEEHGWHTGSRVDVTFVDGRTETLPIGALYRPTAPLSDYIVPADVWSAHNPRQLVSAVYVVTTPGADTGAVRAAVTSIAGEYGGLAVAGRAKFVDDTVAGASTLLNVVYVMLALAVVIAILGIANTLALAVAERYREIGLLRAVGAGRAQVRRIIQWEALLTAALGTVSGTVLGVFFGWALSSTTSNSGGGEVFAVPWVRIALIVLIGALAGLVAGSRPARRAARLDPLVAIASE